MSAHPAESLGLPGARSSAEAIAALAAARSGSLHSPVVRLVEQPARPARPAVLRPPLAPAVAARLPEVLWSHQVEAIDHIRAGRSVVIATGTASGKSLCYQVALAEAASAPVRAGTTLVVCPTKALAHDQLRALTALDLPGVVAGAYDGDASPEERTWIRRHATVVITNPEMLHAGLLPHHDRWSTFLGRLQHVVIDELHTFRGIFGSHVAQVVRRLRRLAAHHGASPRFICCSATVGEPQKLASAITGVDVVPVVDDGSPRGARTVAIWQPPVRHEASGARASAHRETARVVAGLVAAGHTTLGFTRSRRSTEVVAAAVRRDLAGQPAASRVRSYRGGYLAEERRVIEDELVAGRLSAVITTSALELGIDVGGLDSVVLDGFPGTIASFWQQAGRAGRRHSSEAAAVLVAGSDQLDQWFVRNPEELLTRAPEPAVVNPANPHVVDPHLSCAAHELPLTHADQRWWPDALDDGVLRLVRQGALVVRHRGRRHEAMAIWDGSGWPSHGVGLRNGAGPPVQILAAGSGQRVGDVDRSRAAEQVHEGASYLHQGVSWRVVGLDLERGEARVEPDDGSTYTVARTDTATRLLDADREAGVGRAHLSLGAVEVESRVVGFQRKDSVTDEVVANEALSLPATSLCTRAVWYVIDDAVVATAGLEASELPAALHAVEHAAIGMLPLFALCDRWDVGGVSTARHADTGAPTIVIYDAVPGGAGVAELAFEAAGRHLAATLDSITGCPCPDGCPSCVQSPKCGNANEHLDKSAAVKLLRAILQP